MAGFIGAAAHHNPQKKRVAFSENPHNQKMQYARRQRSRSCFKCCAWLCIIITALLMILSVSGFIAVGFLQSSLPKISVTKVHSSSIRITESSRQKFLSMDVNVVVQFDNENDRTSLHYESLRADITAEHVRIGHAILSGFSQKPGSGTKLDVNTTTTRSRIDDANAEILKMRFKAKAMIVDMYINGDVSFSFGPGGLEVKDLPFEVSCQRINEAYLKPDDDPHRCFTKLLSFRGL